MNDIKIGDIVFCNYCEKNILCTVKEINENIATLKGLETRVIIDEKINKISKVNEKKSRILKDIDEKYFHRIEKINYEIYNTKDKRKREFIYTGKILHLDGDRRYSEKSLRYYRKVGLNAVVKNIYENRQPKIIERLLKLYNPDILVITGHDGMIKSGVDYNNINNYKNSKYFIDAVRKVREYENINNKSISIFARSMSKLL